jgi:hypothetical protein
MTATPRRRWFAFSIRTLFVLVTVLGCWFGYSMNWIHQRRERARDDDAFVEISNSTPPIPAPFVLRLLGEEGVWRVSIPGDAPDDDLERTKTLFPEANVNRSQIRPFTREWYQPESAPAGFSNWTIRAPKG